MRLKALSKEEIVAIMDNDYSLSLSEVLKSRTLMPMWFSNNELRNTVLIGTRGEGISFRKADLSTTQFINVDFPHSDFRGASGLNEKKLKHIRLQGANFEGVDLSGVDFFGSNLKGANFKGANLSRANFEMVDISGCVFEAANMTNTRIIAADASSINVDDAGLSNEAFFNTVVNNVNIPYPSISYRAGSPATSDWVGYWLVFDTFYSHAEIVELIVRHREWNRLPILYWMLSIVLSYCESKDTITIFKQAIARIEEQSV